MMRWRAVGVILAVVICAGGVGLRPAHAGSPSLTFRTDPSFAGGAPVIVDVGGPGQEDEPGQIALQPDGKIISAGKGYNPGSHSFDFTMLRYTATGAMDPAFGWNGRVQTDFNGGYDEALAVALQPDGKIVAAGVASHADGRQDFGVVRYNANGSRDTTFGWGGLVMTDFFGGNDQAQSVVVQPDGKIVVGGLAYRSATDADFAIVRYNPNGSLDTTFGWGGHVGTDFFGQTNLITHLVLLPNGKLLATGAALRGSTGGTLGLGGGEPAFTGNYDFAMAQYNANGSLDTTFGWYGVVTTDFFGQQDVALTSLVQPDGKIVLGGLSFNPFTNSNDFALARYNPNGSLDTSFATYGKAGLATQDIHGLYDQIASLSLQPDGKIVAAGNSVGPDTDFDFAAARFNADGTLDTTFATDGLYTRDFFGDADGVHSSLLQPDGKLVLSGDVDDPATGGDDYATLRLLIADPSWISGVVNALPDSAFASPSSRSSLLGDLTQAESALATSDAATALSAMQDAAAHLAACAGANAWVTDCVAQQQLLGLADQVIGDLTTP